MSDLQGSNSADAVVVAEVDKSIHEARLTRVIPEAIKKASPAMLKSVLEMKAEVPDWYLGTSAVNRQHLKELIDDHWRSRSALDEVLGDLQSDIEAFAKPLLAKAVKDHFKTLDEPETLTLQLYIPDTIIFGLDTGATRLHRSSLLAAALHNFEEAETQPDYFKSGSGVLRQGLRARRHALRPLPRSNSPALPASWTLARSIKATSKRCCSLTIRSPAMRCRQALSPVRNRHSGWPHSLPV